MARRKKRTTYSRKKRKARDDDWGWEFNLDPDTAREVTAIILLIMGLICLFSLIGIAGGLGAYLGYGLKFVFGYIAAIVAAIMIILGAVLFYPKRFPIETSNVIGVFLLVVSLCGIAHLFIDAEKAQEFAAHGIGGGYLGLGVTYFFKYILGTWASLVVFVGALLASLLITFNTSIDLIREKLLRPRSAGVSSSPKLKINKPEGAKSKDESAELEEPTIGDIKLPKIRKKKFKLEEEIAPPVIVDKDWVFPSTEILEDPSNTVDSGNIKAYAEMIQQTLANFGIEVEMGEVNVGPTVTQYTLKPAEGIKLTRITALVNDLALALAAHPIRIEAPIPGKSLVGIEIPNKAVALVRMKEILSSPTFEAASAKSKLNIALGKDVSGAANIADLARMPHLLIAGATGSGKSVCINSVLISLLYQNSPRDLKMVLIDPKRVEFTPYNGLPHLLTPVITEVDKTINALRWIVIEMEKRYRLFAEVGARNIDIYNHKIKDPTLQMPYIVVAVDELADLMAHAAREVEALIVRLAQMARATGIHLVLATQRPSVNVVTGLIKANIAPRIAFMVASQIDSRTIIDMAGAERLLGRGDMLYISGDGSKPKRIQSVMVSDKEIKEVTDFVKKQAEPQYNEEVIQPQKYSMAGSSSLGAASEFGDDDPLYQDAYNLVVETGKASASYLQRRLRVGYARAARLLDLLEQNNVIGPGEGAKPREVLIKGEDSYMAKRFDEDEQVEDEF